MNEISHFFYSSATPSQHSLLRFLGIVNLCVNNSIQTNHSLMITLYFLKCKKKARLIITASLLSLLIPTCL